MTHLRMKERCLRSVFYKSKLKQSNYTLDGRFIECPGLTKKKKRKWNQTKLPLLEKIYKSKGLNILKKQTIAFQRRENY